LFTDIKFAANVTTYLRGVKVEAVEIEDTRVLYGDWYLVCLWAVAITFFMCFVLIQAQGHLMARLRIVLDVCNRDSTGGGGFKGQLLRRRSDFAMGLFATVETVAGYIVGKTWSDSVTAVFKPSEEDSFFAGHLWWYFALLLFAAVVGSLLLSMDLGTVWGSVAGAGQAPQKGTVAGVARALIQQHNIREPSVVDLRRQLQATTEDLVVARRRIELMEGVLARAGLACPREVGTVAATRPPFGGSE